MAPGTKTGLTDLRLLALAAVLVAACSGGPGDGAGRAASLTEAEPLPTIDAVALAGAADGCEGQLDGSEDFAITRRDALVVARRSGATVCVDTLEAMTLELEAMDEAVMADELYGGFVAAINLALVEDWATPTSGSAPGAGFITDGSPAVDPTPEARLGTDVATRTGDAMGDPNPQPSAPTDGPTEGDPNPQPSTPTSPTPTPTVNPPPETPR